MLYFLIGVALTLNLPQPAVASNTPERQVGTQYGRSRDTAFSGKANRRLARKCSYSAAELNSVWDGKCGTVVSITSWDDCQKLVCCTHEGTGAFARGAGFSGSCVLTCDYQQGNSPAITTPNGPTTPTQTTLLQEKQEVLRIVNSERAKGNLPALCLNKQLGVAAQLHSDDQQSCGAMSHTGCNGSSMSERITATGYSRSMSGENVAWNQRSAGQVMSSWMGSPGHRANIMNPSFKNIGIGLSDGFYWTQVFGSPRGGGGGCNVAVVAESEAPTSTPTVPPPMAPTQPRVFAITQSYTWRKLSCEAFVKKDKSTMLQDALVATVAFRFGVAKTKLSLSCADLTSTSARSGTGAASSTKQVLLLRRVLVAETSAEVTATVWISNVAERNAVEAKAAEVVANPGIFVGNLHQNIEKEMMKAEKMEVIGGDVASVIITENLEVGPAVATAAVLEDQENSSTSSSSGDGGISAAEAQHIGMGIFFFVGILGVGIFAAQSQSPVTKTDVAKEKEKENAGTKTLPKLLQSNGSASGRSSSMHLPGTPMTPAGAPGMCVQP